MSIALLIYLVGIADNVAKLFTCMLIAACISILAMLLGSAMLASDGDSSLFNTFRRKFKKIVAVPIICASLMAITPSSTTLASMFLVPRIIENDQIKDIAGNSLTALQALTRKWLISLVEEENSKGKK